MELTVLLAIATPLGLVLLVFTIQTVQEFAITEFVWLANRTLSAPSQISAVVVFARFAQAILNALIQPLLTVSITLVVLHALMTLTAKKITIVTVLIPVPILVTMPLSVLLITA